MTKDRKNTKGGPVPQRVLSDRGIHLEQANYRQHSSNVRAGTIVVIDKDNNGNDITVQIGHRCPKCQKRVRSPNHANGDHHKLG